MKEDARPFARSRVAIVLLAPFVVLFHVFMNVVVLGFVLGWRDAISEIRTAWHSLSR